MLLSFTFQFPPTNWQKKHLSYVSFIKILHNVCYQEICIRWGNGKESLWSKVVRQPQECSITNWAVKKSIQCTNLVGQWISRYCVLYYPRGNVGRWIHCVLRTYSSFVIVRSSSLTQLNSRTSNSVTKMLTLVPPSFGFASGNPCVRELTIVVSVPCSNYVINVSLLISLKPFHLAYSALLRCLKGDLLLYI